MSAPLLAHLAALAPELDRVLAAGLARLAGRGAWPAYELDQSLLDLLRLSHHEDACYDRPSTGWAYGAWYHGRRTHDAVRLLAPALAGRTGTVTIADLGAGTGATLWALTALVAAARRASVPLPGLRLVAMDASEPMLVAAEALWAELRRSPLLGAAAAAIDARFELASWTDAAALDLPAADARWLVGGYLFDESDRGRGRVLGHMMVEGALAVGADEVHLVGPGAKAPIAERVSGVLERRGWPRVDLAELAPVWDGALPAVTAQRAEVYGDLLAQRNLPLVATWDRHEDAPTFVRHRDSGLRDELFPRRRRRALVLDEEQDWAARPTRRLTAIVGAAGSGKSCVLVERVVRTLEQWPRRHGPAKVLVTTFNVAMARQLADWLEECLPDTTLRRWRRVSREGVHTFSDPDEAEGNAVTLVNWDKIPLKYLDVQRGVSELSQRRIDRTLRNAGIDPARLADDDRRVVTPPFVDAELRRVIYGQRTWHDRAAYVALSPQGRRRRFSERQAELVWLAATGSGVRTWSHLRIDALVAAREAAAAGRRPRFTHLFLDECQDMTPADFELAALLVGDPERLVVAGDEAQSMHLGASYHRPGSVEVPEPYRTPNGPASRRWLVCPIRGSYRLPVRVCECVQPLAEHLARDRRALRGDHDVALPQPKKPAVLGIRPVVLAATNAARALPQVFAAYRRTLDQVPEAGREITVAERSFPEAVVAAAVPPGYRVSSRSMRQIKGLERAGIVWSTAGDLPAHESELEWIYTILTRTTCLAVLVVDPSSLSRERRTALRVLRRDRLVCWDDAAEAALDAASR